MNDHQSRTPSSSTRQPPRQNPGPAPEHPAIQPYAHHSGPALTAQTVTAFLAWAASVPIGQVASIRERIAEAEDPKLADALMEALDQRPIKDVGLYLLLLSTVGELRDPRTERALISLIWEREHLFEHSEPKPPERDDHEGSCDERSVLSFESVVQSRAAEMLSYLGTATAKRATLEVAGKHHSSAVRFAAIDAHLYNHEDSPETADQLRQVVRPEDVKMVGLPRFSKDMDTSEFDARVAAFYGRYPEDAPGAVKIVANSPTSRTWCPKSETGGKR